MFQIDQEASYSWPVRVKIADAGKFKTATFTVQFKRFKQDELENLLKAEYEGGWKEFLRLVVVGFGEDVMNGSDPLPFNEANLEILMNANAPHVVNALVAAFRESVATGATKN